MFVFAVALGFVWWPFALHGGTFFCKSIFLFVQQPFILHYNALFLNGTLFSILCGDVAFHCVPQHFVLYGSNLFHEMVLYFVIACLAFMWFFISPCSTVGLNNPTQVEKHLEPDWLVTCHAFMCFYITIQHCRFINNLTQVEKMINLRFLNV